MGNDEPQNDPATPYLVWAKAPPSRGADYLQFLCPRDVLELSYRDGGMAKIAEYFGLVHGRFPDGDGTEVEPPGTPGLLRPERIFRGVKRPVFLNGRDIGDKVVIYVTEPPRTYGWKINGRVPRYPHPEQKPAASVFTTFVSLEAVDIDAALGVMAKPPPLDEIDGVILFWEWTRALEGAGSASFERGYEEPLL